MKTKYLQMFIQSYALFLIALSLFAFITKSSLASLITGVVSGGLLLGFSYLWKKNHKTGFWVVMATSLLLTLSFIERALSTGKGLPIFLGSLSFIIFSLLVLAHFQDKKN